MIVDVRALLVAMRDALRAEPALAAELRAALGAAPPDAWIPLAEVVVVAGVRGKDPERTARAALNRDGVAGAKVGGQLVYNRGEIARWLESCRIAPPAPRSGDDAREDARASVAAAAQRFASDGPRRRIAS